MGFPTANLIPPAIKRLPRYGVYVSRVLVDGVYYQGVTNIGKKPTVEGDNPPGAETYIMGLDRDIYGSTIEVQLLDFIEEDENLILWKNFEGQISRNRRLRRGILRKIQIKRVTNPRTLCYTKSV